MISFKKAHCHRSGVPPEPLRAVTQGKSAAALRRDIFKFLRPIRGLVASNPPSAASTKQRTIHCHLAWTILPYIQEWAHDWEEALTDWQGLHERMQIIYESIGQISSSKALPRGLTTMVRNCSTSGPVNPGFRAIESWQISVHRRARARGRLTASVYKPYGCTSRSSLFPFASAPLFFPVVALALSSLLWDPF